MPLRYFQQKAVDDTFDFIRQNQGKHPVIAMPTGTGKSWVIAGIIEQAIRQWGNQKFMMLTHVKELVEQNGATLQQLWPSAPLGIYSAGLKQRDTVMPIIFGGMGSVANRVGMFGHRDVLLIDEAHLLSPKSDSTYQNIIAELMEINPYLVVIGLSATPFRLGQGMITDGGLFTHISCDLTSIEWFNRFIEEGYLARLIPKRTKTELDVSDVSVRGEFVLKSLQESVDKDAVTFKALEEMCDIGRDRHHWLIFASGNDHADNVADMLNSFGVKTASVHSGMSQKERDDRIKDYKNGVLQCLTNNNVLTTGFDFPPIDLIGMLRPTMSPGLWVQMLGRGTRPSPDTFKDNCLVLDFAGNTRRLGPINDPRIPKKKGKGGGDAPVRICEACGTYNHASARVCCYCGEEFTFQTKIVAQASEEELIVSDIPVIEYFDVSQVFYYKHDKKATPSIKVVYHCENGLHRFNKFVHLEHGGFAGKDARDWWRHHFPGDHVPDTIAEALEIITQLRVPNKIKVHVNKKYPEVLGYVFN